MFLALLLSLLFVDETVIEDVQQCMIGSVSSWCLGLPGGSVRRSYIIAT